MTILRVVRARLARTGRDMRALLTWRRREASTEGYAIRLFVVGMLVVVLPVLKLVQLGPLAFVLALLKVLLALALMTLLLSVVYAVQAWHRRRALGGRKAA